MIRMHGKKSSCITPRFLCLLLGCALWSLAADAQGSTSASESKTSSHSHKNIDFKFEVASIRPLKPGSGPMAINADPTPDGFRSNLPIGLLIRIAYTPVGSELETTGATKIVNAPPWFSEWYAIDARVSDGDREAWRSQGNQQELLHSALQALLRERFKLLLHEQSVEIQDVHLLLKKHGPTFKAIPPGFVIPSGIKLGSGGIMIAPTRFDANGWRFYGATMEDLAFFLSRSTGRPFNDMTGLKGRYNFMLPVAAHPSHDVDEVLYNFPLDSLGLELKPGKGIGLALVIDHIEKPSPN